MLRSAPLEAGTWKAGGADMTTRTLALFLVLLGLWLALSGHYGPLLLAFGVLSAAFVVAIALRMDVVDREGQPIHLTLSAARYWPWLGVQVVLANLDVARRILHPRLPIQPTVARVSASQRDVLGRVVFANSITLTPGTVSLEVDDDTIEVHALSRDAIEELQGGEMDRRVSEMTGGR